MMTDEQTGRQTDGQRENVVAIGLPLTSSRGTLMKIAGEVIWKLNVHKSQRRNNSAYNWWTVTSN